MSSWIIEVWYGGYRIRGFGANENFYTQFDSVYRIVKEYVPDLKIGGPGFLPEEIVNLGRWLLKDLRYIILDCPTRGVDVGVKTYIYEVMKKKKAEGVGILMITDELTEAIGMADRIIILRNGAIAGEISRGTDFTENNIIEVMV